MSKESKLSAQQKALGLSVLGILGSFAIILMILWAAYLPSRPPKVDQSSAEERRATLAELEAVEQELTTRYDWVDASKGIVRIPIERAMELIVSEYTSTPENPAPKTSQPTQE